VKRVLFLVSILVVGLYISAEAVTVTDIRFSNTKERTRFVIEFDKMPELQTAVLKKPLRVLFDLKDVTFRFKKNHYFFTKSAVTELRIGKQTWGTRVVFEITGKVEWNFFILKSPPRLVIDFYRKHIFTTEKSEPLAEWTVVIDPGHGGHDPGAIGPGGIKEKDITLAVSKLVRNILKSTYHINVILTREDDRFIPLAKRTRLANSANADLFISIHLNAHRKKAVRGIETYLLNWTNDAEALRVAARENKISIKEMKKRQGELAVILASLKRSAKRDHSLKLAYYLHNELVRAVGRRYGMPNNGIKQALFYVLVGARMPSVLIELAYISNPKEARLLTKKTVQRIYAKAIAKAIFRYLMSLPEAPKLAMIKANLRKYD